jgi:hypothetical protein
MSLNEVLERGQRVRLLLGEKGITIGKNENFEFPLWEIKLENGKMPTVLIPVSPSKQGAHHSSKTFNHTHHENGIKLLFTCKWYLGLQYISIFYKMIDHSWRESSPDRIKINQSGAENS